MRSDGPEPLDEQERLAKRQFFNLDAERYDARRPTYPSALFQRLADYGGLRAGSRVLEVAPGTGQATQSLAEQGWHVTAVEMGADLAAVARRKLASCPHVEVITSSFEEWPLPDATFDAFFCATAWHWLDPGTRLAKVVRALRPGGTVGIVWTHHVAGGTAEFFTAAQECYQRFDPETFEDSPLPDESLLPAFTGEFRKSPLVTDVESHRFGVDLTYTTEVYLELLQTYSTTIRLPPDRRTALLDCLGHLIDRRFGGEVTKRYAFELVLGRSTGGEAR